MAPPAPPPPPPPLPPEFPLILDALAAAGRLTRSAQAGLLAQHLETKTDGSIVTVADYAAQALLNHLLTRSGVALPAVIAEESAAALDANPTLLADVVALLRAHGWPDATAATTLAAIDFAAAPKDSSPPTYYTIDPIDGTKGFAAGRQFAVCLARIEHGRCTLAALACPNLSPDAAESIDAPGPGASGGVGTLFAATDTSPVYAGIMADHASLTPLPHRTTADIQSPTITFSFEPSEARLKNFDALAALLGGATRTPADSQAKYAMVARGQADAYFRPPRGGGTREKVWDHAAGCLLLERAGCTVTNLQGEPITWPQTSLPPRSGILGAPPALHGRILAALRNITPVR